MTIEFYSKNVYGVPMKYIKDKKIAQSIKMITGTKTISLYQMQGLIGLGHSFVEVLPWKKNNTAHNSIH